MYICIICDKKKKTWWKVHLITYLSAIFKFLTVPVSCCFIRLLHYIPEGNIAPIYYIYLTVIATL